MCHCLGRQLQTNHVTYNICRNELEITMAYFKKFTIIAFYAFNVLWIISCKKDIQVTPAKNYDPTVGVVSLIKNDNQFLPAKYVFFQVLQNADAIDTSTSFGINVFGKFTDDVSGTIVNAGNIIINNSQKITSGPDNLYQFTYDQNTSCQRQNHLWGILLKCRLPVVRT